MARALMSLSVMFISVYVTDQAYFLQEDFIDDINEQATTWKAGVNFDPSTSQEQIVKLLGSKGVANGNDIETYKTDDDAYDNLSAEIPKDFDARKKWPQCKSIGHVTDQGNCGSCWAVATSSAFTDRFCIATNGYFNGSLSAEETTFCCRSCGSGCSGGAPIKAWERFAYYGVVTGGDFNSGQGCEPYRVKPCPNDDHGNSTCAGQPMEENHQCRQMCYGDKDLDFDKDHRFVSQYYRLSYRSIQKDVMTYGPIEASLEVYSDFLSYKSGVYVKTPNATYLGGHATKLIGWGEENGVPYWLIVNSWNAEWGEKGLFKIKRGTNECCIDNSTTAGIPMVSKSDLPPNSSSTRSTYIMYYIIFICSFFILYI